MFIAVCRLSLVVAHRLLTVVGSLVTEHGVWGAGASAVVRGFSCLQQMESSQTRDEPGSPALAGGFLTTGPPGKSWSRVFSATSGCLEKLRLGQNTSVLMEGREVTLEFCCHL